MPVVTPPEELQEMRSLMKAALADESKLTPAARAILAYKMKEIPPAFDRVFQARTSLGGCADSSRRP